MIPSPSQLNGHLLGYSKEPFSSIPNLSNTLGYFWIFLLFCHSHYCWFVCVDISFYIFILYILQLLGLCLLLFNFPVWHVLFPPVFGKSLQGELGILFQVCCLRVCLQIGFHSVLQLSRIQPIIQLSFCAATSFCAAAFIRPLPPSRLGRYILGIHWSLSEILWMVRSFLVLIPGLLFSDCSQFIIPQLY